MFDIGWSELLLIGVVALIVVGPKDLPHLFHSLGRFTARARSMAREFTSAMEDAAKSAGIDEASNSIRDIKSLTSKKSLGLDALDRAAERFEKWEPERPGNKVRRDPDAPAPPDVPDQSVPSEAGQGKDQPKLAAEISPGDAAGTGKRRLHAVRRSDTKDD